MRALQHHTYGGPDVLALGEAEEPHAGPGEVRIATRAVAVNPIDAKLRSGAFAPEGRRLRAPRIPGLDAAGVVDEVGEGVQGYAEGDRVFGAGTSVTAERSTLTAFAHLPDEVTFEQGAAVVTVAETAMRILDRLDARDGQVLVVDGASGGVGTTLVQLAMLRGLTVVGTASEAKHDLLRRLGALPTTYGPGLAQRVRELLAGQGAELVAADLAGKGSVAELIELTGDPTRVVTIADFSGETDAVVSEGSQGRAWHALGEVAALVADGRFEVIIDQVLPWTEAAAAHTAIESGHTTGKIVLTVD
ncbi:quinone oxidoreductase family protein [Ruania halotolerans]|uniref:quinone oxidoreductase family protein n=1 Tax=Ruania halotolerans TaxID=2897773 RepID=UPI001E40BB3D|nr:NADP-dependent oxidoreductase [Ruania halotolerans]UFU05278.1 NADP-dependent oxidoreductase [Ruania halotolerans]